LVVSSVPVDGGGGVVPQVAFPSVPKLHDGVVPVHSAAQATHFLFVLSQASLVVPPEHIQALVLSLVASPNLVPVAQAEQTNKVASVASLAQVLHPESFKAVLSQATIGALTSQSDPSALHSFGAAQVLVQAAHS